MKSCTEWTCIWVLFLFHQYVVISGDDKSLPLKSSSDFWATRGRRGEVQSPEDLIFWANRGKRVNYNLPRPNGFLFPTTLSGSSSSNNILDKRKYFNLPRPNGFMFPSSSVSKRVMSEIELPADERSQMMNKMLLEALHHELLKKNYHLPKPNNFFFLSKNAQNAGGKRGDEAFKNYNLPSPNGFLFPSRQGKRADQPWNLATPNGFFFPATGKGLSKEKRNSLEEEEQEDLLANLYSKRGEEVTGDIFFAGRGKRGEVDLDTFFAGRGRRAQGSEEADFEKEDKIDSFWALRGKRKEQ